MFVVALIDVLSVVPIGLLFVSLFGLLIVFVGCCNDGFVELSSLELLNTLLIA